MSNKLIGKTVARHHPKISWLVLLVGLCLTVYTCYGIKVNEEQKARLGFIVDCEKVQAKIEARLQAHKQVLLGGAALFDASQSVERQEWHQYVNRLKLDEHFNGIQGMGFALAIPKASLPSHLAEIRQAGFSDYTVRPAGERDFYTSIIYLEPFSGRNLRAFGFDMYAEATRHAAMMQAVDENRPTLSGKVKLVQETDRDVQAGALMYVPVYQKNKPLDTVAHRRAVLTGWVYSPFRMKDLMEGILLDHPVRQSLHLKVYDGERSDATYLLYDSKPNEISRQFELFQFKQKSFFNGHTWTLMMDSDEQKVDYLLVWVIFLAGSISSVLLSLLISLYFNTRRRAELIASELTSELRNSMEIERTMREQLALQSAALNASPNAIAILNKDSMIEWINPAFTELTGYTVEDAEGHSRNELLSTGKHDEPLWGTLLSGKSWYGEMVSCRKDGSFYDEDLRLTPLKNDVGDITHFVAVTQDVTQRHDAERALQLQLHFAQALNALSKTILEHDDPNVILNDSVRIIGEMLGADRTLIYDIDFNQDKATGLCEWINPNYPDTLSSKATYPLAFFASGVTEVWRNRHYLVSSCDEVNPFLAQDGSWVMLRDRLKIKSLMWYPLAFHDKGFYMLVLNDIHACRVWTKEETDFLDSVSYQVSLALEKIRLVRESQRAEKNSRIAATAFESQECMLILDADCNILRSNQAFTTIAGYTAKEVKGKCIAMLRPPNHDQAFYAAMWRHIDEVGGWEGEMWSLRKNGESYPVNLSITAVKDNNEVIINYVATFTDITESKAAEKEIEHLAFYDALTQLPNRRLLQDRLRQMIALSGRVDHQGALLFIDMDNFKNLNDTLGHDMGDLLLKQVAQRLLACVRESDTVSRLGGDEFVVLLTSLSAFPREAAEQTKNMSEKILAALNQTYQLDTYEYHISPSIGVTLFGCNQISIDELMKQADIAMYQAKKSGRNAICLFDPAMQDAINARVEMEKELRFALEDGQFALYYQLQVDGAHHPVGVEALIRWIHPERGMVSPLDFIPLAEESGLIVAIGRWVIETACAQLKQWSLNDRTCQLTIAVNVSAKQFRQLDFVESIRAAVQHAGIKPNLLKLELTESLLLENISDIIVTMNALKAIGVIFSLDDFGTGYSSLQYLKQLPIDQLKIDQSFVRDIAIDLSDQAIVSTIIAMAKSLKLNVIAEGVETMEQQRFLFSHGCFHYQGYLFGKPMPIEQFMFEG